MYQLVVHTTFLIIRLL